MISKGNISNLLKAVDAQLGINYLLNNKEKISMEAQAPDKCK